MATADASTRQGPQPSEQRASFSGQERQGESESLPSTLQQGNSLASAVQGPTSGSSKKRRWWLVLRVLISAALLVVLLAKANIRAFIGVLLHINPFLALLGLGVGVMTMVLSAWRWQILLKQEAIELSLPLLTGLYFIGHTFGQVLPTSIGGDVPMAAYVARLSKRGVGAICATLMTRIVGLLVLLITALPIAVAAPLFASQLGWGLSLLLLIAAVIYGGGLTVLLTSPLLLRRIGAYKVARYRLGRKVLELVDAVALYRSRPRVLASAGLVSLLFYIVGSLNYYCYGLALHLHSPLWFYWIAIAVTSLTTLLPISLNGYGVRGASFVVLFALMGETPASSLSLAVTTELQRLLFALVGGVFLLFFSRRLKPQAGALQSPMQSKM